MNPTATNILFSGFFTVWLVTAAFSLVAYLNRRPGYTWGDNLKRCPDQYNDLGSWARKWAIRFAVCGASWLIIGGVVGHFFFNR